MRHILERHAPEYRDGSAKGSQTFFEPGATVDEIQDVVGDVLGQNRDTIIAEPSEYDWKLTGTSRGRLYRLSTYQGRVTQVYPVP